MRVVLLVVLAERRRHRHDQRAVGRERQHPVEHRPLERQKVRQLVLRAKEVLRGGAADGVGGEPHLPPGGVADEEGRGDGDGHDGDDLLLMVVVGGGWWWFWRREEERKEKR